MKMIKYITAFTIAAALTLPVMAQDAERAGNTGSTDMEILRQKIKADKKLVVSQNLDLTDAEAAKFWPVYDQYQSELDQINQRRRQLIMDYANAYNKGPVPDATAEKLIGDYQKIDSDEAMLRSNSMPKIMAALPAVKAARYMQIESKIRAAINYELASGIPLIE
jgi:Spy/CpxP family protein refolding chaperone